jgi:hypothetical protein
MARQPRSLGAHPALQLGDKRRDAVLPDSQALAGRGAVDRKRCADRICEAG